MTLRKMEPGLTVKQLRDVLAAFDDDARVLVSGYERGYDDPAAVRLVEVVDECPNGNEGSSWGRYADVQGLRGERSFYAVVIPR